MIRPDGKAADILLVEDNPGDVILTKEAFLDAKIANTLNVAKDGEEAIDYLKKQGEFKQATTPDIILLDLNLPKMDGREVLAAIKRDEDLKRIPVVVLTSSHAEKDVVESYNLHANSYLTKPVDLSKFVEIVNAIENFWFTVVILPHDD